MSLNLGYIYIYTILPPSPIPPPPGVPIPISVCVLSPAGPTIAAGTNLLSHRNIPLERERERKKEKLYRCRMGRRRMAEELQKHLMSITIHGDHFLLLKNKNPFISSSYVILSFCVIGVLFAASASRAAPRCRIIVSSCRIGPKRIPMKILAMISTRMSICSPPRPVTTNEII